MVTASPRRSFDGPSNMAQCTRGASPATSGRPCATTRVIIASSCPWSTVERTCGGGTQLNLERDQHATVLERADNPVEPAEEHRPVAVRVRMLRAIDRAQQLAEQHADVLVGPRRGLGDRDLHGVGHRKVIVPQPDFNFEEHGREQSNRWSPAGSPGRFGPGPTPGATPSIARDSVGPGPKRPGRHRADSPGRHRRAYPSRSLNPAASVTGCSHVKLRHTYAVALPFIGVIAAMNGSKSATCRCVLSACTGTTMENGR